MKIFAGRVLTIVIFLIALIPSFRTQDIPITIFTLDNQNNQYNIFINGSINSAWNSSSNCKLSSCKAPPIAIENQNFSSRKFWVRNDASSIINIDNVEISADQQVMNPFTISNFPIEIYPQKNGSFEVSYSCDMNSILAKNLDGWSTVNVSLRLQNNQIITFNYIKLCTLENRGGPDLSIVIILLIAVVLIISATKQNKTLFSEENHQNDEIKPVHALYFVVFASLSIATIYFLQQYIDVIFSIFFSISATTCLTLVFSDWIEESCRAIRVCNKQFNLKFFGDFKLFNLFCFLISLTLVSSWFVTRHWILNNLIGIGIVCLVFKIIKLPSLRVAYILLGACFFYDIFWVFISKPIFGESVMVAAASNLDIPIKLEWPYMGSTPLPQCSMLGLGDIVLPGFFVGFNYRFGFHKGTPVYYWSSIFAYTVGIILCGIILLSTEVGQPALLYIVPSMLIVSTLVGYKRHELKEMWDGIPDYFQYENMMDLSNRSDLVRLHISTETSGI